MIGIETVCAEGLHHSTGPNPMSQLSLLSKSARFKTVTWHATWSQNVDTTPESSPDKLTAGPQTQNKLLMKSEYPAPFSGPQGAHDLLEESELKSSPATPKSRRIQVAMNKPVSI